MFPERWRKMKIRIFPTKFSLVMKQSREDQASHWLCYWHVPSLGDDGSIFNMIIIIFIIDTPPLLPLSRYVVGRLLVVEIIIRSVFICSWDVVRKNHWKNRELYRSCCNILFADALSYKRNESLLTRCRQDKLFTKVLQFISKQKYIPPN